MPEIRSHTPTCFRTSSYLQHFATVTEVAVKYLLLSAPPQKGRDEKLNKRKEMPREKLI